MKKYPVIISTLAAALAMSAKVFAEEQQAAEIKITDVLVSFLYFLLVLALIFIILVLVEKWGKKHPDEEPTEENGQGIVPEKEEKMAAVIVPEETEEAAPHKKEGENT